MPDHHSLDIKRVAILFAGGPAPAANAVISTAAFSFSRRRRAKFSASSTATVGSLTTRRLGRFHEGTDYVRFTHDLLTHAPK